jgi:lipopolysaccharide/colanic/teichoic acid biosynthesis glycosyltransferase
MAKRAFDVIAALVLLVLASPVLAVAMIAIWLQDGHSPLHRGLRVGRGNRDFRMAKLRSMAVNAEARGGTSTARGDPRITPLGSWLRRWKIDELPQFWNVLIGDMSLVGPRPNSRRGGVDRYTADEMGLLEIRPGITDLASIVFADEGDIIHGAPDPDAAYDIMIRPWKSQLGLLYVEHRDFGTDLQLVWLTGLAIVARPAALRGVDAILGRWGAEPDLRRVCARSAPLPVAQPPEPAT